MKIYAINGSPRKNSTTARLCMEFLKGAAACGGTVQTELIHLSDLQYSGCLACYACKRKGNENGRCPVNDGLFPLLPELAQAGGLAIASPVFLGGVTGMAHSFLERLLFPFISFAADYKSIAPKSLPIAMLYTMMVSEEEMHTYGYPALLARLERSVEHVFSKPEIIYCCNAPPTDKLDSYNIGIYGEENRQACLKTDLPAACQKAAQAGMRMGSLISHKKELPR